MAIKITGNIFEGNGIDIQWKGNCYTRCCNCGNVTSGEYAKIDKPCVKCQGTVYDAYVGDGKPDWGI